MPPVDPRIELAIAAATRQGIDSVTADTTETIRPEDAGPVPAGPQRIDAVPLALCVGGDDPRSSEAELVVGALLGKGAMGTVHVARERALDRDVAVKRLRNATTKNAAALRKEARLTGSLEHPNIIPVHSLLRAGPNEPVLVMKRVEGHTWRSLIRKTDHPAMKEFGLDPLERHLEILIQICRAMEFAHDRGVLHLDLKPANVMVGDFGATWLMDWGVAIRLGEQDTLPEREVAGTPAYMAPEMLEGRQNADARTDVYLLGACLHEVLTGRPRHIGSVLAAVFGAVLKAEPASYGDDVPPELGRIANQACAADPGDRFQSVTGFREAITEYLRRRGARALLHAAHRERSRLVHALDRPVPDPERVGHLVSASRFAYEQVLLEWHESDAAEKGLQDVLVRAIRWELGRDNVVAVGPLLAALPVPRPDLAERYANRTAALAAERDARVRLDHLEREGRFGGGDWSRVIGMAAHGVAWAVLLTIWAWATRAGHVVNTPELNLRVGLGGLVVVSLLIVVFRGLFLDNQMRRSFTAAYGVFCFALLLNRVAGLQLDVPFLHVVLADHAVLVSFFGMLAARGLTTLWWATGLAAAGMVAIGLVPAEPLQVSAVTVLAVNLVLAWSLRPGGPSILQP